MDLLAIGARIRSQREYLGYTREQLAEHLGVTPKFCSDIELGAKRMCFPTTLWASLNMKSLVFLIL